MTKTEEEIEAIAEEWVNTSTKRAPVSNLERVIHLMRCAGFKAGYSKAQEKKEPCHKCHVMFEEDCINVNMETNSMHVNMCMQKVYNEVNLLATVDLNATDISIESEQIYFCPFCGTEFNFEKDESKQS